jgi:hypothetical protein
MADKKISELTAASTLTGSEEIPLVQSSSTVKVTAHDLANKYISKHETAQAGNDVDLDGSAYDYAKLIKFTWSGANGTAVYTLPDATNHADRIIRFISDDTFNNSTHVELTPKSGQTLDGSANDYDINKAFEGIAVWSDGTEWYVIQKKA